MAGIVPVVLAAGDSTRMGAVKALLPLGDSCFLETILATLESVPLPCPVVVLGRRAAEIRTRIGRPVRIVHNPEPERGQLSSLQLALFQIDEGADACLVWPVDHPLVSAALVRRLKGAFESSEAALVLPHCGGRRGHPAILHRRVIEELRVAPLEQGAKPVIKRHSTEAVLVPTGERGTVEDCDTPEDYARITRLAAQFRF